MARLCNVNACSMFIKSSNSSGLESHEAHFHQHFSKPFSFSSVHQLNMSLRSRSSFRRKAVHMAQSRHTVRRLFAVVGINYFITSQSGKVFNVTNSATTFNVIFHSHEITEGQRVWINQSHSNMLSVLSSQLTHRYS